MCKKKSRSASKRKDTEEVRLIKSEAAKKREKNRVYSDEQIKNWSEKSKNNRPKKSTRKKISKSLKGRVPWNKDKTYEEMYGKEEAELKKKQTSKRFKNKPSGRKGQKQNISKKERKLRSQRMIKFNKSRKKSDDE